MAPRDMNGRNKCSVRRGAAYMAVQIACGALAAFFYSGIVWVLRILSTAAFAKDLIFGSDPWIWHAGFEFMPDGRFGYVRHPSGMPDS